ncbi:DUF985 domain protein [Thermoascus aurantiacus ATCC 26904]
MDIPLSQIKPFYPSPPPTASGTRTEPPAVQATIDTLRLSPHVEGGYFVETDRDPLRIPNPFLREDSCPGSSYQIPEGATTGKLAPGQDNSTRNASTTIYYYLTPGSPLGAFHRNRGRTVHTLHRGRGRYVIIHADEVGKEGGPKKARIETFVVGHDIAKGERLQWIVEGGKYKASFLLPDKEGDPEGKTEGLLISETVVPGFEFADHDFMLPETMEELLTPEQVKELSWMLRKVD